MLNNAFVNVLSLPTMILNYNFRDMQVAFIISLCVTNRLYTIENLANVLMKPLLAFWRKGVFS